MYIPFRLVIWTELNDPIVTSKLSVPVFTQVELLQISIYFLCTNVLFFLSYIGIILREINTV